VSSFPAAPQSKPRLGCGRMCRRQHGQRVQTRWTGPRWRTNRPRQQCDPRFAREDEKTAGRIALLPPSPRRAPLEAKPHLYFFVAGTPIFFIGHRLSVGPSAGTPSPRGEAGTRPSQVDLVFLLKLILFFVSCVAPPSSTLAQPPAKPLMYSDSSRGRA